MTDLTGSCACGQVTFRAKGGVKFAFVCHCRACQRLTGTGHATAVASDQDQFTVQVDPSMFTRASDSGYEVTQHFCPTCGSPLYNTMTRGPGIVMINWGAFDDPSAITPDRVFEEHNAAEWDRVHWHNYTQGAAK